MLPSCAPVNNIFIEKISNPTNISEKQESQLENKNKQILKLNKINFNENEIIPSFDYEIQNKITIILSKNDNPNIVKQFINIIELAVYQKN